MKIERMVWDSNHYGIGVGRLNLQGDEDDAEVSRAMAYSGFDCMISRVASEDYRSAHLLEKLGFRLMDVKVIMDLSLSSFTPQAGAIGYVIRDADESHLSSLCDIARTSFRTDHFHVDKRFDGGKADEMYALWVMKCFREKYFMDVAFHGPISAGFVASKVEGEKIIVELVATAESHRGRGVARSLLTHRFALSKETLSRAEVAVQLANIPAVRLYEEVGFRVSRALLTYHFWLDSKQMPSTQEVRRLRKG